LVPAQQVDAGEDWVEYLLPSGERWRDQGFVKRMENVSCL
jgi:hypothetical protein